MTFLNNQANAKNVFIFAFAWLFTNLLGRIIMQKVK